MAIRDKVYEFIKNEYNVMPEILWPDYPKDVVFRNKSNKKWFAIMMNVSKSKLGLKGEQKVDIINTKCDPLAVYMFIQDKGILPAYHMNKNHWVSILLDESCDLNKVFFMIEQSYNLIQKQKDKK